jgi:hypothetical protein
MFKQKYIYVKLTKEWGGFQIGDVIRFGISKGEWIIDQGKGNKVKKQPAANDPAPVEEVPEEPKVETADAPIMAEKAVVTPKIEKKKVGRPKKGGAD